MSKRSGKAFERGTDGYNLLADARRLILYAMQSTAPRREYIHVKLAQAAIRAAMRQSKKESKRGKA